MADDDLTQRERRAMRHSKAPRRQAPGDLKRKAKAYGPVALILVAVLGAGFGVYYLSQSGQQCVTDHWHATFGIYIPDQEGAPQRIDFQTPRTPGGLLYYDYTSANLGGAASFSMTLHMHLTGAEAEGPASLGPAQIHMEQPGKCVGVRRALNILEVDADSDSLRLFGGHEQVPGQHGTFTAEGDQSLRYWVRSMDDTCAYNWEERSWSSVRNYQLQDGESLLVALGDYDEAEVDGMKAQMPDPISRNGIIRACQIELEEKRSGETTGPDGTGTTTGTETGTATGTETGTETGAPTGTETGTAAGTETGTATETGTGA